jgi:hypothetical protein
VTLALLRLQLEGAVTVAPTAAVPTVDIITYYNQLQNTKVSSAVGVEADAVA